MQRFLDLKVAALPNSSRWAKTATTLAFLAAALNCNPQPGVQDAVEFVEQAEEELLDLTIKEGRASWVQSNFITHDTDILAAEGLQNLLAATAELAQTSARFNSLDLPDEVRRKIEIIKTSLPLAAPSDPEKQAELAQLSATLRAYSVQPFLFRESANDGFHEGIGDTVALSITPEYLKQVELLETVPPADADLGILMRMALDKVAFLPFGLLVDKWRWKVFSGEAGPDQYNQAWWELRRDYQGIAAPVERSEQDFDPGAKYHVPDNTPYARYFIAHILQFQFHRALCRAAGYQGPLNRCSIYGSGEAGARLAEMLKMGRSRPWPDALETLTGEREMDATAILDYFAPLKKWLDEQNSGRSCGW